MYSRTLEKDLQAKTKFLSKKLKTECSLGFDESSGVYVIDLATFIDPTNSTLVSKHVEYVLNAVKTLNKTAMVVFVTNYLEFDDLGVVDITTTPYTGSASNKCIFENVYDKPILCCLGYFYGSENGDILHKYFNHLLKNSKVSAEVLSTYLNSPIKCDYNDLFHKDIVSVLNDFFADYGFQIDLEGKQLVLKNGSNIPLEDALVNGSYPLLSRLSLKLAAKLVEKK